MRNAKPEKRVQCHSFSSTFVKAHQTIEIQQKEKEEEEDKEEEMERVQKEEQEEEDLEAGLQQPFEAVSGSCQLLSGFSGSRSEYQSSRSFGGFRSWTGTWRRPSDAGCPSARFSSVRRWWPFSVRRTRTQVSNMCQRKGRSSPHLLLTSSSAFVCMTRRCMNVDSDFQLFNEKFVEV